MGGRGYVYMSGKDQRAEENRVSVGTKEMDSLSQPFPIKFPLLWAVYFHSRWARPSMQGVMNSNNLNIFISQCPSEPKMSLDY